MAKASFIMPKSVQIGPILWKIRKKRFPKSARQFGECCESQAILLVEQSLAPEVQQETTMHELLHAICFTVGIPDSYEERVVAAISPVLLDVLKKNPELVMYLTESVDKVEAARVRVA